MHITSEVADTADLTSLSSTAASIFQVIAKGSKAHPPIGSASRAVQLTRVAGAGAWTDAALALVELELPHWHVRRIERDGGEWHCTLSRYAHMPRELDDAADGRGPSLPLAILDAFLEARRRSQSEENPPPSSSSGPTEVVWCDNVS